MRQIRTGLAGLAVVLLLVPSVAQAKNFCISGFPNPNWLLVGKGFVVPGKGVCKAWLGFNPANTNNSPTNGIGCTSSDGTNLSLNVTTSDSEDGFVEIDSISLALPAKTGSVVGQDIGGNSVVSFSASSGITGAVCTTNTIPAVSGSSASEVLNGAGNPVVGTGSH
jgi:hypothetical protein